MYMNSKVVYDNCIDIIITWVYLYLHLIEVLIPNSYFVHKRA
jgi:hypothetical protein